LFAEIVLVRVHVVVTLAPGSSSVTVIVHWPVAPWISMTLHWMSSEAEPGIVAEPDALPVHEIPMLSSEWFTQTLQTRSTSLVGVGPVMSPTTTLDGVPDTSTRGAVAWSVHPAESVASTATATEYHDPETRMGADLLFAT
jgi:hypothetical protein